VSEGASRPSFAELLKAARRFDELFPGSIDYALREHGHAVPSDRIDKVAILLVEWGVQRLAEFLAMGFL
jgi:hypothetical protein